jgi:Acetyltransferase (GNAT) domain
MMVCHRNFLPMNEPEITVKVASTAADIEKLRPFWSQLNYNPESDLDFVTMLASSRPEIAGLHILVASEKDQPVAIFVGRVEDAVVNLKLGYFKLLSLRLRQLVFVRDGFLGECTERVTGPMIAHMVKASGGGRRDVSVLCNIPADSSLNVSIRKRCPFLRRAFSVRRIEHWKGSVPETYEAFLAARGRKHRGHFRRLFKHFEAEFGGKIRYATFTKVEEVEPFCKAAEEIAQNTYQRGLNAGFADNEENRRRLTLAAQKGWFRGYVVFVDDKPLAFWGGENVKDVMYVAWTGYNPAYRKFELGTIVYLKMVEDLISLKVRRLDYGLGSAQYKERFGDECLQEHDTAIYGATAKGYLTNAMLALEIFVNRTGKRVLSWLKLKDRMKRKWRADLAGKAAAPTTESEADSVAREVTTAQVKGSEIPS